MYLIAMVVVVILLIFAFMVFTRNGKHIDPNAETKKKLRERERELEFLNKVMEAFADPKQTTDSELREILSNSYFEKYRSLVRNLENNCIQYN